ncbi:MAG: hypothetical protein Q9167_007848, partial [Letrouitia subvulpina]
GEQFILEEDRDGGHGCKSTGNIAERWKQDRGLKYYYNCAKSPDLSAIESSFQPLKQWLSNTGHWDIDSLQSRAEKGWNKEVSQAYINKQIESME